MPDYNYDGYDDFTGQYIGFNFARNNGKSDKKMRYERSLSYEEEMLYNKGLVFAKLLQGVCLDLGFNKVKGKEKFDYSITSDGKKLTLCVHIEEEHSYTTGFIFKEKHNFKKEELCGFLRFNLNKNFSNFNQLYCENFRGREILPETKEKWSRLEEKIDEILNDLNQAFMSQKKMIYKQS